MSKDVIDVVDNVLEIPQEKYEDSDDVSSTILDSINILTETIQETSSGNFTYNGSNIVVAAVKVERTKFPLSAGIGASPATGDSVADDSFEFKANDATPSQKDDEVSVSIPEEILDHIKNPGNDSLTY